MREQRVSVSADDLHAASQQAAMWEDAVRRAERGETVAVIAHGEHVADVVPSGDRLRETIDVLSDSDLVQDLRAGPPTPYSVAFTSAARRAMNRLPLHVAAALFAHITGALARTPTVSASLWGLPTTGSGALVAASTGQGRTPDGDPATVIVTARAARV